VESTLANTIDRTHSPAAWLKSHYQQVWWITCLLCFWPAVALLYALLTNQLSENPLQAMQQISGQWALNFLIITLTITPLRRWLSKTCQRAHALYGKRLADWNWIIRLRRMLGMFCFFYAALHLGIWLHFDLGYDWQWLIEDMLEKPYLLLGLFAFVLLLPMAATSTDKAMRLLGRNWRKLHRLIYVIAIAVIAHYWLGVKPGIDTPWFYSVLIFFLLAYRLVSRFGWLVTKPADDGMEVTER